MIEKLNFEEKLSDSQCEQAANVYLMSLVSLIGGLPLPIINLLTTFFFFVAYRKASYFVRWHCCQALVSQLLIFFINTTGFWWTISVFFIKNVQFSNAYIAYLMVAFVFNLTEFVISFYTAIQVRKGKHIFWWFYGDISNKIVKK